MSRLIRVPAVLSVLAVLAAGCAHSASSGSSAAPTPTPSPASTVACAQPATGTVDVTEADNGARLCLAIGARLELYLHGGTDRWSAVSVQGAVLHPATSGKGALAVGVTGGFFTAAGAGQARVTAQRSSCPSPAPSTMACGARQLFEITVTVR
jgi:hypothetical protein